MVDLMYYHEPTKQNKSWVQDCTGGAMDLMYYHGPTQKNKSSVQDCIGGVVVDLMYYQKYHALRVQICLDLWVHDCTQGVKGYLMNFHGPRTR